MQYDFTTLEKHLLLQLTKRHAEATVDCERLSEFAESLGIESQAGSLPERAGVTIRDNVEVTHTPFTSGAFGDLLQDYYEWATAKLLTAIREEEQRA